MAESAEQIRKHIAALSNFEQKYGEFLVAAHNQWAGDGKTWTSKEFAERKREIQMLAVRADSAMKASGVGQFFITHPPAMGGGIKSTDLPSQVFDFDGPHSATMGWRSRGRFSTESPARSRVWK